MTVLRAQVTIPRDSGIPADIVMNTWHFQSAAATSAADAALAAFNQLDVFYAQIDSFFASYVASPANVKIYDLSDDEPRVPIFTDDITLSPATGPAYPAEVAICLSYRGVLESGTNPARRRGRIFLGPLDADAGELTNFDARATSSIRGTIVTGATDMANSGFGDDAFWVVFSPTLAGSPPWDSSVLEDSSTRVMAGYIDDAFDTVRSRGADPTARSTFTIAAP